MDTFILNCIYFYLVSEIKHGQSRPSRVSHDTTPCSCQSESLNNDDHEPSR